MIIAWNNIPGNYHILLVQQWFLTLNDLENFNKKYKIDFLVVNGKVVVVVLTVTTYFYRL